MARPHAKDPLDRDTSIIVLSFLGTGRYQPCDYEFPDGWHARAESEVDGERIGYLLPILLQWLQHKNSPATLQVFVCCTDAPECLKHYERLSRILADRAGVSLDQVRIQEGRAPKEWWHNVQAIEAVVPDRARLVMDVTHGYRSFPVVGVAIAEYLRAVKDVEVLGVYYGAFEARSRDSENAAAPVLDLSDLVQIVDWASAYRLYQAKGDPAVFVEPLRALAGGRGGEDRRRLPGLLNWFSRVGAWLELAHVRHLNNEMREAPDLPADLPAPMRSLLDRVVQEVATLAKRGREDAGEDLLNKALRMLDHYQTHERWMHLVAVAREALVLAVAVCGEASAQKVTRQNILAAEKVLGRASSYPNPKAREQRHGNKSTEYRTANLFTRVSRLRNEAMHCSLNFGNDFPGDRRKTKERLDQLAKDLQALIFDLRPEHVRNLKSLGADPDAPPIFLNVSNHPAAQWSAEQRECALGLAGPGARIEDLPFPDVDPTRTDEQYVRELSENMVQRVFELPGRPTHAMVQGEHVLTMLLVGRLQGLGVACYAATTRREVRAGPDGAKVSYFAFEAFRPYPRLAGEP